MANEGKGAPLPLVTDEQARPEKEPRGVQNFKVIDLIHVDADSGDVVLTMLEERPWPDDDTHLRQLEHKFNAYLGYVLDGYLGRDYPEYAEKKVCFRLECATAPGEREQPFLTAVRNYAAEQDIRFVVEVAS